MQHRHKARLIAIQAIALLMAWLMPAVAWSVCVCGIGDGEFTLAPITLDGNIDDWASVHADPDNNVCDGPANGLVDADAPVQSTGRDLTHFAFTFDNDNVYLFTERSEELTNTQSFVYYADTNNDGLMQTGEPVIGVTWRGSNRRIEVYVFTYVASAPGGDGMADGSGQADGYTLPGSFTNGVFVRSGPWGSSSGQQMEFRVTWGELGLAPNTPFTFHVSSSNASLNANSFASQVDDNLSGCGGGLGTMVQSAVTFAPDRSLTGVIGNTVVGVHTLSNDGNADDAFDFSSVASGAFTPTVSYYADTDGSGDLGIGDTLLTDTTGDGAPDTGMLAPGASMTVLVVYTVPGSVTGGQVATVVVTAASDFNALANASVTDTIDALPGPNLQVVKDATTVSDPVNGAVDPKAIPGATVEYTVSVTNQGVGTVDADTFVILDPVPSDGCLIVADIAGAGSGPVAFADGAPVSGLTYSFVALGSTSDDIAFSNDGGVTFNYTPTPGAAGCDAAVTHIDINPKGEFAADTGAGSPSASFSFRVVIN